MNYSYSEVIKEDNDTDYESEDSNIHFFTNIYFFVSNITL